MADAHLLQMPRVFLTVNPPSCDHSSAIGASNGNPGTDY